MTRRSPTPATRSAASRGSAADGWTAPATPPTRKPRGPGLARSWAARRPWRLARRGRLPEDAVGPGRCADALRLRGEPGRVDGRPAGHSGERQRDPRPAGRAALGARLLPADAEAGRALHDQR